MGGLIGNSQGVTSISNCIVSATITCNMFDTMQSYHGGFVGHCGNNMTITNCLFNGKMNGIDSQTWSGFVGLLNGNSLVIKNSLFAPEDLKVKSDFRHESATFCSGWYPDDHPLSGTR